MSGDEWHQSSPGVPWGANFYQRLPKVFTILSRFLQVHFEMYIKASSEFSSPMNSDGE